MIDICVFDVTFWQIPMTLWVLQQQNAVDVDQNNAAEVSISSPLIGPVRIIV